MNEEASRELARSSWLGWTLGLLAALIVYVLSVPPLYLLASNGTSSVPTWVGIYSGPYNWLADRPMLAAPMREYFLWWVEVLDVKGVW